MVSSDAAYIPPGAAGAVMVAAALQREVASWCQRRCTWYR